TMYQMRAPGMTFTRMPLFCWAQLATAPLLMIATTALAAALAALFMERQFGVPFYDPTKGGSPVMWQHMFWFYSHPAVYIMILPAFGMISEIIPTFARKPIFGYKMIAFSSMAIALAGFMVWAHHMFTSGLAPFLQLPFMILTFAIGVPFYDPTKGGSPVMWQHMFWFYSHPAVYIMILPAFGMISEIIPTFARKPIFGYKMIAFSSMAIALAGFMVWAHHMFTSGLAPYLQLPFMILTFTIAIPTGVKIFSWVATLWGGKIHYTTSMLFACGFLALFTLGGITGVFLAAVPFDLHVHGTYFVVAHFHYVLVGGSLMGIFAGMYYYFPKMSGRLLSERLGKWHFWLFFLGFNGTFLPQHWLGTLGMPRRVPEYDPQFTFWNQFSSISSYVMTLAILIFFVNVLWSLRNGKKAGPNPWGARTLEWQIPSPPHYYNFKHIPTVYGLPYDFGQPLPYKGLEEELTDTPVSVGAH
ncbi:MAG: cbb3-type cytochrome c oxidase subunit I, partial [Candidatus Eremiobacteraeota bacterium]|nr:cbb3-type cytochrome c oxidase subunit I [Candidatus Eremiobacteraeota bacterium]